MSSHGSLDTEAARALLAQVLRDPFGSGTASWLELLTQHFRLWCFERYAFLGRQTSELPTTHPLPLFVESILSDEGLEPNQALDRLATTLDRRRLSLSYGDGNWPSTYAVVGEGPCKLHMVVDLTCPTAEEEVYLEGDRLDFVPLYLEPYVTLGQTLVQVIEAREQARAVGEEEALKEANESVDKFLRDISAKLGAGRPAAGLTKKLALPLVREGRDLLSLCWRVLPARPSEYTWMLLAEYGFSDKEECDLWATRLALPVLSLPEIEGLLSQRETADGWSRAESRPTPRLFTIWGLAHRVGMQARGLARKTLGSKAEQYFVGKTNPIDATGGQ